MFRKTLNYLLITVGCAVLLFAGFALGFSTAKSSIVTSPISVQNPALASSTPDMALFWQAWQLVNDKYLRAADVSDKQKLEGATAGLVQSLGDPYSEYFPPSDAKSFEDDVNGNFGGIGAELGIQDGVVTVVAPLKGSPAAAKGIKAGDQILMIDATSTKDFAVDQAAQIIRGTPGTSVKLSIMRKDFTKPEDFTIVRQQIAVPTLDMTMKDGHIAYIQLYQFNANASGLFQDAIRKAALQGANSVVLDLRGDPGGYLDVAVDIAGWFLPRGTLVVSQQGRDGPSQMLRANGNAALANVPMVVLIDKGSASAAEILAGTLRDNRKVPLVGDTSFGKGTVQQLEDLPDGSLVKLTIAHWVLPSGKILEDGGLKPDYAVSITSDDVKNSRDPQLDKAMAVLQQEMTKK